MKTIRKHQVVPHIRLVLYNNNVQFLERAKEITQVGAVLKRKQKDRPKTWSDGYLWSVSGVIARLILIQILPWLIIKRDKAKEAIDFSEAVA